MRVLVSFHHANHFALQSRVKCSGGNLVFEQVQPLAL